MACDDNDVPLPIQAVRVLRDLFADHRKDSQISSLFVTTQAHFVNTSACAVMTNGTLSSQSERFRKRHLVTPRPWNLSDHQYRKTFGRFVLRTDKAALAALSDHFGHLSIALTDKGYVGKDWRLKDFLSEEGEEKVAADLMSLIDSNVPLAGPMGDRIMAARPRFRGMTVDARWNAVRLMVKDLGLLVHSCDICTCVYRRPTSLCAGGPHGPSLIRRGPSLCAKCENACFGDEHRPFWEARHDKNVVLLQKVPLDRPLQRAPIEAIVVESQSVLDRIERASASNGG